jgi:preprotein translocase subunit SecG
MATVLIVIHLMVVLALIGLVLLQRSEGGALGIGGSGGVLSGRGAGNMLTRTTAILAAVFFLTSVGLSLLARVESQPGDILDRLPAGSLPAGQTAPSAPAPIGAPTSAEDLLQSLGGPQAPPPDAPAPSAPAAQTPTPAAPDAVPVTPAAPAPTTPPAAETPVPTSPTP